VRSDGGRRGTWSSCSRALLCFAAAAAAADLGVLRSAFEWEAAAQQQIPAAQSADLTLGAGDLLAIEVLGLEDLSRKVRIGTDGTIRMPMVGSLDVAGLKPPEVEELVAQALREKQLVNAAAVSVIVEEYVSRGVSVMGAVAKPGTYQVVGGKTVFDVLLEAGGVVGKTREILIIRELAPGRMERITVDATELLVEGDLTNNVEVLAGDVVVVPEETTFKVFVNGAVSSQGPIEFAAGSPLTLLQAISAAGGSDERANLSKVRILRRRDDGTPETIVVNLKRVRKGLDQDVVLQENDIVVVDERFF
jgi:polysaccharide export outer membrane protein